MPNLPASRMRIRKFFGDTKEITQMPNLIEVQKASYSQFLKVNTKAGQDNEGSEGLLKVFKSVFPINDFSGGSILEFVHYALDPVKHDVEECRKRGITYAAPLRVTLRLIVFDNDEVTGVKSVKDIKEQDVYLGDMPLMTNNGTFLINGTERVVVSQMHRSPGVFFDHDRGKTHVSGKLLFAARIIPYRGSWLDFEFDAKDIIYVRIDRKRKLPVTTLLYALGFDGEEILSTFYDRIVYERTEKTGWRYPYEPSRHRGLKIYKDIIDADTQEVMLEAGRKFSERVAKLFAEKNVSYLYAEDEDLLRQYLAEDLVNMQTGEIWAEAGEEITEELLERLDNVGVDQIPILDINHVHIGPYIRNTLILDKNSAREGALFDIYRVIRPGEPPTLETAENAFRNLFFDSERYDLSAVGRVKMNMRLDLDVSDTVRVLRREDIVAVVKALVALRDGKGEIDDIDHLGNRRVRSVGELLENQYAMGLLRMERAIKERMSSVDIDRVMPQDLINAKPVVAAVREFFGSSQLSQFMDQTNPLSEITHKRRLSALGPGGLTRERAGFEVRDVHPTHYGRICPIETPEGPNIGLINSLATYASVNKYGFIETPFQEVKNGVVTDKVVYLSAMEEAKYYVAQATVQLDENNRFVDDLIACRHSGDVILVSPERVDLIDVSPKQLVSVAAALIPFLENNDANRALMGSNMQRQAVPLLHTDAPYVGTGIEALVAKDSGAAISAKRSGIVDQVDSTRIVIRATDGETHKDDQLGVDIYWLQKFQRSNQSTCINQKPLVRVGDRVESGEIIADGPSTEFGELALGRNVLVAFMPWNGYNFEDSILLSERIVKEDVFTSIHIEEFEIMARDTKLGPEEITRDIPNISEESLRNLDESGIICIGADVAAGDILCGKITPRGESPMTPEEKLLRAIFGEKASDVKDTSLRVPPGITGTVVEVRVFNRHGVDKDGRAQAIESEEILNLSKDRNDERNILDRNTTSRLHEILIGQELADSYGGFDKATILNSDNLRLLTREQLWDLPLTNMQVMQKLSALQKHYSETKDKLQQKFLDRVEKLQRGDDLPPGVMKTVKIFIAVKRKIQAGDKMAGRHGNKGVVSCIVPIEDMPFLEDGTPVDIVLNPLGVPSRMNVGQILETHLGWAAAGLGKAIGKMVDQYMKTKDVAPLKSIMQKVYSEVDFKNFTDEQLTTAASNVRKAVPMATPVFSGAKETDIEAMLELAGLSTSGQSLLYDGRTGEPFDRKVTVGYIYMLKLHHLVDDKIHARSIGPYSLVTQQPLGGKAQFGGQRFGEMEVWALEAYGAAYTLQEMLTVKSDDVAGRTKVYEAIVRGDDTFEAGIPESFNVLVKEMRSLGLDIELLSSRKIVDLPSEGLE